MSALSHPTHRVPPTTAPHPLPPPPRPALALWQELNHPTSLLSKYVTPLKIPHWENDTGGKEKAGGDEEKQEENNHNNTSSQALLELQLLEQRHAIKNIGRSGKRQIGSHGTLSRSAQLQQQYMNPLEDDRAQAARFDMLIAQSSPSHAIGASSSFHPSSSITSSYPSSLQRQLHTLFPNTSPSEILTHSRFQPNYYLAPKCGSLAKEEEERKVKELNQEPEIDSVSIPLPITKTSTISSSILSSPTSSILPALTPDQHALLQSVYDRVEETYPIIGGVNNPAWNRKATAAANATMMLASPNGPPNPNAPFAPSTADPSHRGLIKQFVARSSDTPSAPPAYDVFHLPPGFKVVKDENYVAPSANSAIEDKNVGGTTSGGGVEKPNAQVKARVKSVLKDLARKYEVDEPERETSSSARRSSIVHRREESSPFVTTSASTAAGSTTTRNIRSAGSAPLKSAHQRYATPPSIQPRSPLTGPTAPTGNYAPPPSTLASAVGATTQPTPRMQVSERRRRGTKEISPPAPMTPQPPSIIVVNNNNGNGARSSSASPTRSRTASQYPSPHASRRASMTTSLRSSLVHSAGGKRASATYSGSALDMKSGLDGKPLLSLDSSSYTPSSVPKVHPRDGHAHVWTPGPEIIEVNLQQQSEGEKMKMRLYNGMNGNGKKTLGNGMTAKSARIPAPRGTQLLAHLPASVRVCCLISHTNSVWTVQRDAVCVIRDRTSGKVTKQFDTPGLIWSMLSVGDDIWFGTETGSIVIYNTKTFAMVRQWVAHSGGIHTLVRAQGNGSEKDGQEAGVFSGSNDFTMILWNVTPPSRTGDGGLSPSKSTSRASALIPKQHFTGHAGGVRCIVALSSGRVWSGGDDGSIRVWDVETGLTVQEMTRHTGSVLALVTTGQHVWSGGEDGTICQWSLYPSILCVKHVSTTPAGSTQTPARINTLMLVGSEVWSCGQSPDVQVWNAHTLAHISTLRGHARYLSSFVNVRILESRMVWSYGLGEESIGVWRCEQIAKEDVQARYVTLLAQVETQREEIRVLRERTYHAETTQVALNDTRSKERLEFQQTLDEVLLKLAQSTSNQDHHDNSLTEAQADVKSLATQNAELREELHDHISALRRNEGILESLLGTIELKVDHIDSLQNDAVDRDKKYKHENMTMKKEYYELKQWKQDNIGTIDHQSSEITQLKQRVHILQQKQSSADEALSFYTQENMRLHKEVDEKMTQVQKCEEKEKMKEMEWMREKKQLEKIIDELVNNKSHSQSETVLMRKEMNTLRAQSEKHKLDYDTLKKDMQRKDQEHSSALSSLRQAMETQSSLLEAQAQKLTSLEQQKLHAIREANEARTKVDNFARELSALEKRVRMLLRPDSEVYQEKGRKRAGEMMTFQQGAMLRDGITIGTASAPTPALLSELQTIQSSLNDLMHRGLTEDQKLHVGFAVSGGGAYANVAATARSKMPQDHQQSQQQLNLNRPSTSPLVLNSTLVSTKQAESIEIASASPAPPLSDILPSPQLESHTNPAIPLETPSSDLSPHSLPFPLPPRGIFGAPPQLEEVPTSTSRSSPPPTAQTISASSSQVTPLISYDLTKLQPEDTALTLPLESAARGLSAKMLKQKDGNLRQLEAKTQQRRMERRRAKEEGN